MCYVFVFNLHFYLLLLSTFPFSHSVSSFSTSFYLQHPSLSHQSIYILSIYTYMLYRIYCSSISFHTMIRVQCRLVISTHLVLENKLIFFTLFLMEKYDSVSNHSVLEQTSRTNCG